MNILITGATGFVGSNLTKKLLKNPKNNIYYLRYKKKLNYKSNNLHIFKITDFKKIVLFKSKIDCIIHCAQSEFYNEFPDKSEDIYNVNIALTFKVLDFARKIKIKNFIYLSTGSIYDLYTPIKKHEKSKNLIDNFYQATKYSSEILIKQYMRFFKIDILRIFGVYGPAQKKMLFFNIYKKIVNNQTIKISQKNGIEITPIYIDDLIFIINKLIFRNKKSHFNLYNVCGTEIVTLKEIVSIFSKLLNKKPKIKYDKNSLIYVNGSNRKIIKEIGHIKFIDLETGISKMIKIKE